MALPENNGTYILNTDASNTGVGVVLFQLQSGVE